MYSGRMLCKDTKKAMQLQTNKTFNILSTNYLAQFGAYWQTRLHKNDENFNISDMKIFFAHVAEFGSLAFFHYLYVKLPRPTGPLPYFKEAAPEKKSKSSRPDSDSHYFIISH